MAGRSWRKKPPAIRFFPSPLVGEGGSPRSGETGEGSLSASISLARGSNPSSGASRHLLPQGEKEERKRQITFLIQLCGSLGAAVLDVDELLAQAHGERDRRRRR